MKTFVLILVLTGYSGTTSQQVDGYDTAAQCESVAAHLLKQAVKGRPVAYAFCVQRDK